MLILLLFFAAKLSFACQCPLSALDQKELLKYEVIFKGKIKFINLNKENSEAVFMVSELYKGMLGEDFTILFNDTDPCKLELRVGDEWIIYSNYYQIHNAKLDFCSRSRKYIRNIKEDYFAETTGISYDEEQRYLQENLGLHKLMKKNPNTVEDRNIIPDQTQFVVILICSMLGLILFYWLFGKFFK
ncbi:MAG: hypothetical protein V4677_07610 [Bacteroidota bacterium]